MKYSGPGVSPAEIAQKARDLQWAIYERKPSPASTVEYREFNKLVNIVTALAETTQWFCERVSDSAIVYNISKGGQDASG